jgi:hypothetical protein
MHARCRLSGGTPASANLEEFYPAAADSLICIDRGRLRQRQGSRGRARMAQEQLDTSISGLPVAFCGSRLIFSFDFSCRRCRTSKIPWHAHGAIYLAALLTYWPLTPLCWRRGADGAPATSCRLGDAVLARLQLTQSGGPGQPRETAARQFIYGVRVRPSRVYPSARPILGRQPATGPRRLHEPK